MKSFPKSYDFRKVEEKASNIWEAERVVEKAISYDATKPLFSWLEGPPTANAPPALHHVEVRVYKDLLCRYYFMKGFTVPRKGGWDCHGLPVEVQVEKKLGLKTKKDVLTFGVEKFNKLCRDDVFSYIGEWTKLTKKMAFWIDLENPYITYENNYIESVWWSLAQLFNKGLLYEDHKVVPYCPRCETPLSSHEVALGYNDVADMSITAAFKLKNEERYLLAWTTTPWTTPSNIALAVNPNFTYAVVEQNGKQYILAKELASKYFENPVIITELAGENLVGREYEPLFDYFVGKLERPAWKVIGADYVSLEEGTGIVHQAPAFGEEDFQNIKKNGMAFIQPVTEDGKFTSEVSDFEGMFVKDADEKIIEYLEKEGKIFKKELYNHSYPFCWRCDTPLLYFALMSWFIKTSRYKNELLANNEKINWTPEHIKHGRFGEWLSNVKDWALSRNKFWGTPLPIWKCAECKNQVAVGSIEELKKLSNLDEITDLHKPYIDEIKLNCECGMKMNRVSQVIDTWYDSGSASFAQFHYPFENKEMFEKAFPYDHITEAIDQTRGWFYTLHVLGTLLFNSNAYKDVVSAGHLVDEKGEKMSKSKGNIINPWTAFDELGVDAVRLQMCTALPGSQKRFSTALVNEQVTPFLTILWNCAFFAQDSLHSTVKEGSLQLEDSWLISRVNRLVNSVTQSLDSRTYSTALQDLKYFVMEDFSRWYIKLVRSRQNDSGVSYTMNYVLNRVSRLLAPFAPYLSEYIYSSLPQDKKPSVHLESWPEAEDTDAALEKQMEIAKDLTQAILAARTKIQRGVRYPVKEVVVLLNNNSEREAIRSLASLIKSQANVKKIILTDKFEGFKVKVKADYAKIGPAFGKNSTSIIAAMATSSSASIAKHLEQQGSFEVDVSGKKFTITNEHVVMEKEVAEPFVHSDFSYGQIFLNKEITDEMQAEGLARETARRIQDMRKKAGLSKDDGINLCIKASDKFISTISAFSREIRSQVGAIDVQLISAPPEKEYEHAERFNIKDEEIEVLFNKN